MPTKKSWKTFFPWLWLFLCFAGLCLFLFRYFSHHVNADMSGTLAASWNLAKEGKLFSSNWYYATEFYAFTSQLIFVPLFALVDSWRIVRFLGTIILFVLMLLSFYFLCSQTGLKRSYPLTASVLLLPFSNPYFNYILIASYYLPHIIQMFLLAGLFFRSARSLNPRKHFSTLILLALLSFLCGFNGIRIVFLFHLPAFCLAIILTIASSCKNLRLGILNARQSQRLLLSSAIAAVCAVAGFLINSFVFAKHFSFVSYNSINFISPDSNRLWLLLESFFSIFGYSVNVSVFSKALAGAGLCLCVTLLVIACVVRTLAKKDALPAEEECGKHLITLFWLLSFILFAAVLMLTDLNFWEGHLVPVAVFVLPIIAGWFVEKHEWKGSLYRCATLVVAGVVLLSSVVQYADYAGRDLTYELRVIADVMTDEGYTDGYATFWQGNVVTELSDGKIDMRVWDDDDVNKELMDVSSVDPWLQTKFHETTVPEGKPFLLFSKYYDQQNLFSLGRWLRDEDILFETDNYIIYGYESYTDLLSSVDEKVEAVFADGTWLAQNYRREGDPTLQPGSEAIGPNVPLYPGVYSVTITGDGLSSLGLRCLYQDGEMNMQNLSKSENTISFELETSELIKGLEIQLDNTSSDVAVLNSLTIEKNSSSSLP